jgi:predicted HTH transcriptional regulator
MMVDERVGGVTWKFEKGQKEIVEFARQQEDVTAHQVEQNTNYCKDHARKTLNRLISEGAGRVNEGEGDFGRNIYYIDSSVPSDAIVDLGTEE